MLSAMNAPLSTTRSEPKQLRARMKRLALLDAAAAEFGERGYEHTTAKSIATRANVASGSFYQYFSNKDEALRVVAERRFAQISDQLSVPKVDSPSELGSIDLCALFRDALAYVYAFHASDQALHEVLEQRRCVDPALNALMHNREGALLAKVRRFVGLYGLDDPDTVAFCLHAMAEGIVHRHVFHPNAIDREAVLDHGAAMLAACFQRLIDSGVQR